MPLSLFLQFVLIFNQSQLVLCSAPTLYAKQMQNISMKASWETPVYAIEIGLNCCSLPNNLDRWIVMPFKMCAIHIWMSWCTFCCKVIMRTKMFAWSFILRAKTGHSVRLYLHNHYSSSILLYFVKCCKHLCYHEYFIRPRCVPFR